MSIPSALFALAGLVLIGQSPAFSQTVVVTTGANDVDINFFTGTIADLPGPDGKVSLQEALIATNNAPGHQTIQFNIPQAEWTLQFLYPGRAVVQSNFGSFVVNDSVTFDGASQTAFTGDTNPAGHEVVILGTVYFNGANSLVSGLDSSTISINTNGCQVLDNTGTTNVELSGDQNLVANNTCGTIKIQYGNFNTIVGNTMQRVRIWGLNASSPAIGNRVGGASVGERNFITGYGTVNSEGAPGGVDVELFMTQDTVIENNYIGTTPDGLTQGHQYQTMGIRVGDGNTGLRVRDNLISGVLGHGQGPHYAGTLWGWAIYFDGSGDDVVITNNRMGVDVNGAPTLGSVWGVHTGSANYSHVRFGGLNPGEGNVLTGNRLSGITVGAQMSSGLTIQGNSIYGNALSGAGFLGIDLLAPNQFTGVTLNDALDADVGGNGLQNFPVIQSAEALGAGTRVVGVLNSEPSQAYTLEFFASPSCGATGFGEGQHSLGFLSVLTNGAGQAAFDGMVSALPAGWVVTATATNALSGSTSEFSACQAAAVCAMDLGFQGPGRAALSVCAPAPLATGVNATLRLAGAAPIAPAWVAYGPSLSPTPLFGGVVAPQLGGLYFLGLTDAQGSLTFGPIPGGGGLHTLFAQVGYVDLNLAEWVGLSNAVQVDFLP